eukprot:6491752-Amphidinium_carterae.2
MPMVSESGGQQLLGPVTAVQMTGPRQRDILPFPASSFEIPLLKDAPLAIQSSSGWLKSAASLGCAEKWHQP